MSYSGLNTRPPTCVLFSVIMGSRFCWRWVERSVSNIISLKMDICWITKKSFSRTPKVRFNRSSSPGEKEIFTGRTTYNLSTNCNLMTRFVADGYDRAVECSEIRNSLFISDSTTRACVCMRCIAFTLFLKCCLKIKPQILLKIMRKKIIFIELWI